MIDSVDKVAASEPGPETATEPKHLKPLGKRVIVLPEKPASMVRGILLPDSARKQPTKGVVMAAGPKCEFVKAGDVVLYSMYAGSDIELPGGDVRVLQEEDILGQIV